MSTTQFDLAQLTNWAAAENDNFARSVRYLTIELQAYDALGQLYLNLWAQIQKIVTRTGDTHDAVLNCYQIMMNDLIKGTISLCRGHVTDARFYTRRTIETATSIVEIMKDVQNATIWLDLAKEGGEKAYVNKFMVYKLVRENFSKELKSIYDQLCLSVHPSFSNVAGRQHILDLAYSIDPFDIMSYEDEPRHRKELIWLFSIHLVTLRELSKAFINSDKFNRNTWQTACDEYKTIIDQHLQRLYDSNTLPQFNEVVREIEEAKAASTSNEQK